MVLLYRLGIGIYSGLIWVLAPFKSKAKKFISGRKDWEERLKSDMAQKEGPVLWFHAASLGEFEQGRPVMEEIKKSHPFVHILLTFFSPSGYEIRKNYELADWVHYMPVDTPGAARRFIELVKPTAAIFIKYEFWYFFLKTLQRQQVPTVMVSCIFRSNQLYFHWSGRFYRPILRGISHYFLQDEESRELAHSLGISKENITVTGDTRFDRVQTVANHSRQIPEIEKFKKGPIIVIGSSWPSDMEILFPIIDAFIDQFQFIIAPHNIGDSDIRTLEAGLTKSIRFSKIQDLTDERILIIDNMGMLSSVYGYGQLAFVGGGFRGALHNTLEAAVYGIPVYFGGHEKNRKFREAMDLIKVGAAFEVSDANSLKLALNEWISNEEQQKGMARAARAYIESKLGATDRVVAYLSNVLS